MAKAAKPVKTEPSARDLVEKLQAAGEAAAAKPAGVLQVLMTGAGFRLIWAVEGADNPNLRVAQDIPFAALAADPEVLLRACSSEPPKVNKAAAKPAAPEPRPEPQAAALAPEAAGPRAEAERRIALAKARYATAAEAPDGPERDAALAEAREHQAAAAAAFREALTAERAA